MGYNFAPGEFSKTDVLRFNVDGNVTFVTDSDGSTVSATQAGIAGARPRFTKRIVESIALYMPHAEMTFTDAHEYKDISFTSVAMSGINNIAGGIQDIFGDIPIVGDVVGIFTDAVQTGLKILPTLAALGGTPMNPRVEVIFSNTAQRQFTFEFLFAPSSPDESVALENIIRTLRFHAAPEVGADSFNAFFFIPPSEFDITFYRVPQSGGIEENTHIPRINTCVLQNIEVSYSPSGIYSTFSNGHPVAVRLTLMFKETEIAHKLRVLQGF